MPPTINGQVGPSNAGFRLADAERLRHTRRAYARLYRQMTANHAEAVATRNIKRYLVELDAAIAAREAVAA